MSDGKVGSAVPSMCLGVSDSLDLVPWMPVCLSCESDGGEEGS